MVPGKTIDAAEVADGTAPVGVVSRNFTGQLVPRMYSESLSVMALEVNYARFGAE